LKVVFLNTFERTGGAGIAGYRLYHALKKSQKADLNYLFQFGGDFQKYQLKNIPSLLRIGIEKYKIRNQLRNSGDIFKFETGEFGMRLVNNKIIQNADILHIHWVNQGFLSLKSFLKLVKIKPIVWTLHDMWAFTGGCGYSMDCRRYENSCGRCPFLRVKTDNDISNLIWRKKEDIFRSGKIILVCPSQWMADRAKESSLGKYSEIVMIPNPIDTDMYSPGDRLHARHQLNLNPEGIIYLFGAQNIDDDRKGFHYLAESLKLMKNKNPDLSKKITLVVFGATRSKNKFSDISVPVKYLGSVNEAEKLKLAYQASDYYVHCASTDNLPNTIAESLACGTPVIAFNTGGISGLVRDGYNGFLADHVRYESLVECMIRSSESIDRFRDLNAHARQTAIDLLSMNRIAGAYYQIYEKITGSVSK
jgi:glycosyltransferase involved in cell wall biosynthesis